MPQPCPNKDLSNSWPMAALIAKETGHLGVSDYWPFINCAYSLIYCTVRTKTAIRLMVQQITFTDNTMYVVIIVGSVMFNISV
jgi:hypothetical protein